MNIPAKFGEESNCAAWKRQSGLGAFAFVLCHRIVVVEKDHRLHKNNLTHWNIEIECFLKYLYYLIYPKFRNEPRDEVYMKLND